MSAARPSGRRARIALTGVLAAVVAVALGTGGALGGFSAKIQNSTNSAGTAPYFQCSGAETADRSTALLQYALGDPSGSTSATDNSGNANGGTYQGTMTASSTTPMACSRDGSSAYVLNGTSSNITTTTKFTNPTTFTLVLWFKTTVASGKLIGFGSSQTGSSGSYDRHVYLTTAGKLTFGIYSSQTYTVTSPASYTDGAWHQVVATLAPSGANAGMTLYVDGKSVASSTAATPQNFAGWWRIGYDNQGGWPGVGTNAYFTGSMRNVAVYSSAFSASQVLYEWAAGQ